MKHYALIFHTNSNRTLTPKEQHERQVEITAWAKQVTGMGVQLDPRALGETATNFSAEGDKIVSHDGSSDPTCTMAPLSRYESGPTPARPQPNPDRQPRSTEEEKHP